VQGRKFGDQIVVQGGVALNCSVVRAFTARLKKSRIIVHPHPGVSGAIGMALLTLQKFHDKFADNAAFASSFKGLDFSTEYTSSFFTCKGCENRCEVSRFNFKEGSFHFGDLCGKYSESISGIEPGEDNTAVLSELMEEPVTVQNPIAVVGVPRALLFLEFYPFWRKFFAELSIQMKVSGPSGSETLSRALLRLSAETCLPVKCLFGHIAALEKEDVTTVFIPSISKIMDGVSCPYILYGAAMVHSTFKSIKILTFPLIPGLPEKERERLMLTVAELFGVDSEKVTGAYESATREFMLYRKNTAFGGRTTGERKRPLAVLLGKPYNIGDRFVNMSLGAKLAKAGFDVIAVGQLDIPDELPLPRRYNNITWAFSRRMLKAAIWLANTDDIYPVVVGNFGCGPDSFTFPLLQEIFEDRPSLFLEFDEHRGDAGLATRVEAFAHRVANWRVKAKGTATQKTVGKGTAAQKKEYHSISQSKEDTQYIIPYFSDHAKAFAGAIAAKGFQARVLPLPDHKTYETGVEFSGGKQCHPFQLIAGDLVNLARTGNLPDGARYLLPTVETSCPITQYIPTIQSYMNSIGRGDVKVISTSSLELLHLFGPVFVFNLGKAILGIEYLSRLRFERRPYEVKKGSVDTAYFAGLEIIYQRQLEEKTNQGIMEAAQALDSVPTAKRGTKPVIAIAGDAYTRVNQAANGGLFELLEGLGCEVWLSPTMVDVIMTGQEILARQYWEAGKTLDMMSSWGRVLVNNFGASSVMKNFEGLLANFREPDGAEVLKYTDGLLPGEPELLVSLNVAKHVDFANKGVDGILNVYCLNCLIGTATTSIFKGLAERTFGVPMMPLVFDSMGVTHVKNRVEAFVHRVKRNREEKLVVGDMSASAGRVSGTGHVARLKELFDRKLFDAKFLNMKMPSMKFPSLRLPEDLWSSRKGKKEDEKTKI
jgi:predicted nucleotide-binding protein (sugar kinase/HSP70/actin superfamily)